MWATIFPFQFCFSILSLYKKASQLREKFQIEVE